MTKSLTKHDETCTKTPKTSINIAEPKHKRVWGRPQTRFDFADLFLFLNHLPQHLQKKPHYDDVTKIKKAEKTREN